MKLETSDSYDSKAVHHWNGTVAVPAHTKPSVIVVTDNWNVTRVVVERQNGTVADMPFLPDARYNVTFRAVDIMGYTAECTSEVSTFTTRRSWKEEKGRMEMKAVFNQTNAMHTYFQHETYKIASPYHVANSSGKVGFFDSTAGEETFVLKWTTHQNVSSSGPGGWFVNPTNGEQGATPEIEGLYTATLVARDISMNEAVVKVWNVRVTPRADVFEVKHYTHLGGVSSGYSVATNALHRDPATRALEPWGVGEAVRFAPIELLDVVEGDSQFNAAKRKQCTFTLHVEPDTQRGVFINPQTGEVLAQHNATTSYNLTIYAVGPDTLRKQTARVGGVFHITIKNEDTSEPRNGPNNRKCERGRPEDGLRFDAAFTCDCGETRYSGENCETMPVDSVDSGPIVGTVFGILLLGTVVALAVVRRRAYLQSIAPTDFEERLQAMIASGDLVPEQISGADRTPREIKRSWLTLVETIGHGNFGEVWKGTLDDQSHADVPEYMVAAKTVLDITNQEATDDLLHEATVMHTVGRHEHLVSLIGVITTGDPYVIILGLCEHGSIRSVLDQKAANGTPMEVETKLRMCRETALGMIHLNSLRFVHRDLAARNVLLASGMVCKVADFGLSRGTKGLADDGEASDYYRCSGGVFPVKWTPPEAIETSKFSSSSDVWSFGIFAVEVFQNGMAPYLGLSNPDIIKMVVSGERHHRPQTCPRAVYTIMLRCWHHDPNLRPNFAALAEMFGELAKNKGLHETAEFMARPAWARQSQLSNDNKTSLEAGAPVNDPMMHLAMQTNQAYVRSSELESGHASVSRSGSSGQPTEGTVASAALQGNQEHISTATAAEAVTPTDSSNQPIEGTVVSAALQGHRAYISTATAAEARNANDHTPADQHGAASNAADQYANVEFGHGTKRVNNGGGQHSMENVCIAAGPDPNSNSGQARQTAMNDLMPSLTMQTNRAYVRSSDSNVGRASRSVPSMLEAHLRLLEGSSATDQSLTAGTSAVEQGDTGKNLFPALNQVYPDMQSMQEVFARQASTGEAPYGQIETAKQLLAKAQKQAAKREAADKIESRLEKEKSWFPGERKQRDVITVYEAIGPATISWLPPVDQLSPGSQVKPRFSFKNGELVPRHPTCPVDDGHEFHSATDALLARAHEMQNADVDLPGPQTRQHSLIHYVTAPASSAQPDSIHVSLAVARASTWSIADSIDDDDRLQRRSAASLQGLPEQNSGPVTGKSATANHVPTSLKVCRQTSQL